MFFGIAFIAADAFAVPITFVGHNAVADIPEALLLMGFGVAIGIIGTLIGAGGGFLHVPMLMIMYNFSPQHAIGTSIAVVFLNALSGTFSYMAQKKIDYEIGLKFSVVAVPGVFIGAAAAQSFSLFSFSIVFGLFLLVLSYFLLTEMKLNLVRKRVEDSPETRILQDASGEVYHYAPDMPVGLFASFFVGIVSGLFGIGGGIIHVPLMYSVLGVPVHLATAISHFILAITAFFGMLCFIGLHQVDMSFAMLLGIGTILGAYYGARLSLKTHPRVIKKIVAFCLFLLSMKLLFSAI